MFEEELRAAIARDANVRGKHPIERSTMAPYCDWLPAELPMRNGKTVKITSMPRVDKRGNETEAILKYQHCDIPGAAWEAMGG